MARETVKKKLREGTLVRVGNQGDAVGLVLKAWISWSSDSIDDICYLVYVRGREVKAYGEGLTVIGDT